MYEQTLEIEHRLTDLLKLVHEGSYSTPRLAKRLRISIPTVSRGIRALRSRGHNIRASRLQDGSWCYQVVRSSTRQASSGRTKRDISRDNSSSRVGA